MQERSRRTRTKNLLRDLIDQSLLVQRAKDDGINVDADVIKRLDAIRQQYKLPAMEALEAEVNKTGQDFEDFKGQIRDQLLTQELIRKEVGSRIIISHEEVVKYYDEHKSDFVRPETVVLREIFVSTDGKARGGHPRLAEEGRKFARPRSEERRRFWRYGQALFGQFHCAAIGRTRLL